MSTLFLVTHDHADGADHWTRKSAADADISIGHTMLENLGALKDPVEEDMVLTSLWAKDFRKARLQWVEFTGETFFVDEIIGDPEDEDEALFMQQVEEALQKVKPT